MNVYYITSVFPPENNSGGSQMRAHTVSLLSEEFNVIVVSRSSRFFKVTPNLLQVESKINFRTSYIKFLLGANECIDVDFVRNAIVLLKEIVTEDDVLLCTSGGELEPFIIGKAIKDLCNCSTIYNYRDPITIPRIFGYDLSFLFKFRFNFVEKKLLASADYIFTSSVEQMNWLKNRYGLSSSLVSNNYFGYSGQETSLPEICSERIKFVYGGASGPYQKEERFVDIFNKIDDDELTLELYTDRNYEISSDSCKSYDILEKSKFQEVVLSDRTFLCVSLFGSHFSRCIPSKIYDAINNATPILALVPEGGASALVNDLGIGKVFLEGEDDKLLEYLTDKKSLSNDYNIYRSAMLNVRQEWAMKNRIKPVINKINELSNVN